MSPNAGVGGCGVSANEYSCAHGAPIFNLCCLGCREEELSVYSELYEERGCITVRYTAPHQYTLCQRYSKQQHLGTMTMCKEDSRNGVLGHRQKNDSRKVPSLYR
jgi:hypothetical protein